MELGRRGVSLHGHTSPTLRPIRLPTGRDACSVPPLTRVEGTSSKGARFASNRSGLETLISTLRAARYAASARLCENQPLSSDVPE